jgi:protease IV
MNKRPIVYIAFGGIIVFVVLAALGAAASLFLGESPVVSTGKVALIRVEGVILDSEDVVDQLKKYAKNSSVKAIVLRIDSPGGAVVPSQEIYEEISKLKAETKQKVVTSMGTVAASGGYYIASASDKIVANPGTLTGSIGVILELASVKDLLDKIGIKDQTIKSGARKDVGSFTRNMTPEEKAYLQSVMDDVHGQFVEAVAKGRGMRVEDVWPIADGSVYTGKQAKDIGLVDELGDLEDAIKLAGRLGKIEGEPKVITEEKKYSIWDLLRGKDASSIFKGMFKNPFPTLMYLYKAPLMM